MNLGQRIALGVFAWITSTLLAVVILQPALAVFVSAGSALSPAVALAFVVGMINTAFTNMTDPVGFALIAWPLTMTALVMRRSNTLGVRWGVVAADLLTLFLVTATHNRWIGLATGLLACALAVVALYRIPKVDN